MALIEPSSTPTGSVQDHGAIESRGSRELERKGRLAGVARSWIARARASVWTPVLARGAGVMIGMLGLATIGALATARGVAGHPIQPTGSAEARPRTLEQSALTAGPRARQPAETAETAEGRSAESRPVSPAMTEDGKVILNLATVEDLQRLPGIGKKRAETILALRAKLGGKFRKLSDLLRIRGIGPRRLKQLTPLVLLDPKEAPAPGLPGAPMPAASARASPAPSASPSAASAGATGSPR